MIIKEHVILALDEDLKKKRQELIELIKECDIVRSEIADQRRGKNEVYTQKVSISSELYTLESILEQTQKVMESNRANYHKLTDKQREKIKEFNEKIAESMAIIAEYEGKELIDIDSENRKRKLAIGEKSSNLQDIVDELEQKKKEKEQIDKEINVESERIKKEREELLEYRSNLEQREKNISIKERRLEKLKK